MSATQAPKKKPTREELEATSAGAGVPDSDQIGSGFEGGVLDQAKAWLSRIRGGEMGVLPAVAGLIVL